MLDLMYEYNKLEGSLLTDYYNFLHEHRLPDDIIAFRVFYDDCIEEKL